MLTERPFSCKGSTRRVGKSWFIWVSWGNLSVLLMLPTTILQWQWSGTFSHILGDFKQAHGTRISGYPRFGQSSHTEDSSWFIWVSTDSPSNLYYFFVRYWADSCACSNLALHFFRIFPGRNVLFFHTRCNPQGLSQRPPPFPFHLWLMACQRDVAVPVFMEIEHSRGTPAPAETWETFQTCWLPVQWTPKPGRD